MSLTRTFALAIIALLLAVTFLAGSAQAATFTTTETRTIQFGEYSIIMFFRAESSSSISYSFDVQLGSNVDILVLNQPNFEAYVDRSSFTYLPGTILDSQTGTTSASTSNQGEVYYVLIDNTDAPIGGASPTGTVEVHFSITATNVGFPNFLGNFLVIIVIGAVLFVAVILILLYLLLVRKPKPQAPPQIQPGMKVCPNCGSNVPVDFQYCPRCGKKW